MAESTTSGARPQVFCSWSYPESGLRLLRARCDVEVWEGKLPAPPEVTHQRIADGVEGVFAMPPTDRLDKRILAAAPRLRAVTGFGVGFDYIDVDAATKYGVAVTNTPGRAGGHDGRAGLRADAGGGAAAGRGGSLRPVRPMGQV